LKYGDAYQSQKVMTAASLFGEAQSEVMLAEPNIPDCNAWSLLEKLEKEREVTGIYISGHPLDDYKVEIENFVTCSLDQIDEHKNKPQINLAGLVLKARHMVSKNGNGWGIFEIRDYNGSIEFKLFGEDYQKFKHLLEEGKALFLKGAFQRGWGENADLEFKPKEVKLLEGLGETLTQSITLKVQVDTLTPDLVQQLDDLCKRYKGQHRLKMELFDNTQRLKLNMAARERKVLANNDFVAELVKMGVEYRLN
ncbi:MAG: OB-fold nucleic acid binding domain-containing protein, partial [Saprospiraceae bacterium]